MLPEVRCLLAALDIEAWHPRAGIMRATLTKNVHHAILSTFLAVHRRLAAIDVQCRSLRAGNTEATLDTDIYHAVLGMLLAVHPWLG